MPGSSPAGPLGTSGIALTLDQGTLTRANSPTPGTVGARGISGGKDDGRTPGSGRVWRRSGDRVAEFTRSGTGRRVRLEESAPVGEVYERAPEQGRPGPRNGQ